MKEELHKRQSSVDDLPFLNEYSYENIFNVYKDGNHYAYNILKTIKFPRDIDESTFTYVRVDGKVSWTHLSHLEYGTIRLWWLMCVVNGILNPVKLPKPGTVLKVIKPTHVQGVVETIKSQLANTL